MEGEESENHELCPLTIVRNKLDSTMFISTIGGGEIYIGFKRKENEDEIKSDRKDDKANEDTQTECPKM